MDGRLRVVADSAIAGTGSSESANGDSAESAKRSGLDVAERDRVIYLDDPAGNGNTASSIRLEAPKEFNGTHTVDVSAPAPVILGSAQLFALEEAIEDEDINGGYYLGGKRVLDTILVLLAIPLWLPLYVVIGALLLLTQGRPVHYRQKRVGRDGKDFSIIKFRTMRAGADAELFEMLLREPGLDREYTSTVKLRLDPRVTPIGAQFRRWSLDELPQLWNVLLGDMSLVGPRPVKRGEWNNCYGSLACHVFRFRPGMTGLWQTSRRPATTYEGRVFIDAMYSTHCAQLSDIKILAATIPTIFRGHGAV